MQTHEHSWSHIRKVVKGGCYYWCTCGSRLEVRYPESETESSAVAKGIARKVIITPRGEFIHLS